MKPAKFSYHVAQSADEAVALLAQWAPADGRVLAGGQSLVPAMALRLALPAHLVDINGVAEFAQLRVEEGALVIGACVRHAAFERAVVPGPLGAALAGVARHIAHAPIRTRGTFCGSIANADPASEWCVVAAALDAVMVARSVRGSRRIAAPNFFQGMLATALAADELLIETRVPLLKPDARWGFYEFNRRAGDFALAMAFASYRMVDGVMVEPRVALGGVESQARRMNDAEAALAGRAPGMDAFAAAADIAAAAVDPIDEKPGMAAYKRDLTRTAVRRALEAADNA